MKYEDSVRNWLYRRKITEATLNQFSITCDGIITIPVCDPEGNFLFNKYRRNPFLPETGPKYWYDKGQSTALFGAQFIKDKKVVVITEGELDALVLWSHNIPAVSSTSGARTFREEWVKLLENKEVYICYDNDKAGAEGAVNTLSFLPFAKVILLPETAGVKDISDYYERGGDLRDLIPVAKIFTSIEEVRVDLGVRRGMWQSIEFHEALITYWQAKEVPEQKHSRTTTEKSDDVERAKSVPIENIVAIDKSGYGKKAKCVFHNEDTASMHIYPDNHAYCFGCGKRADVIDIVRELYHLEFKDAVKYLLKNY